MAANVSYKNLYYCATTEAKFKRYSQFIPDYLKNMESMVLFLHATYPG